MRTLCLLRHAKSSYDDPTLDDHDRPLARRGREAAPLIGAWIKAQGLVPDRVLCSSATRARATWALIEPLLDARIPVKASRDLYLAEPAKLRRLVQAAPRGCSRLLVIGHNPALAAFAQELTGAGKEGLRKRLRRKFPTAALAVITFEVAGWDEVGSATGTLTAFVRPKDLAGREPATGAIP